MYSELPSPSPLTPQKRTTFLAPVWSLGSSPDRVASLGRTVGSPFTIPLVSLTCTLYCSLDLVGRWPNPDKLLYMQMSSTSDRRHPRTVLRMIISNTITGDSTVILTSSFLHSHLIQALQFVSFCLRVPHLWLSSFMLGAVLTRLISPRLLVISFVCTFPHGHIFRPGGMFSHARLKYTG